MKKSRITSLTNARIKHIVQLRKHRKRGQEGLTIVEGSREVQRAMEAGVEIKEVYVCGDFLNKTTPRGCFVDAVVYETTPEVFTKISYGNRTEGILALCKPSLEILKDLQDIKNGLFVVIEGVEKPGNLGAILRTCDGAGVSGVLVCDEKTDIYNPNVIRASLGTVFSVNIVTVSQEDILEFLKKKNIKICAALPQAKKFYTEIDMKDSLAIVMGSEDKGLSEFWINHADSGVRIPMKGRADSLNVSTSTAILVYEAIRQREK